MTRIPVFAAERQASLERRIRSSARVAYASAAELSEPFPVPFKANASTNDVDLHFLKAVLVTVGWNKNDDVFDPVEVWRARATAEDKPFNYEHNCADIIGHIVGSYAADEQGELLSDDTESRDLPAKYHVVTSAVLYKVWEKAELQERMDRLLGEIAEGKWFVSMECLFNGFDYVLAGGGASRVVARNEETAFLTKHLRAYGGSGQYGKEKIGRLLRNIVFSGKGLVRKPANSESVILANAPEGVAQAVARYFGSTAEEERFKSKLEADIFGYLTGGK